MQRGPPIVVRHIGTHPSLKYVLGQCQVTFSGGAMQRCSAQTIDTIARFVFWVLSSHGIGYLRGGIVAVSGTSRKRSEAVVRGWDRMIGTPRLRLLPLVAIR